MDPIQEALDELSANLGRSLTLDSPRGELLAFSAQGAEADPVRVASILSRHAAPEVLAWEREAGVQYDSGLILVPANENLGMGVRLCAPVHWQGRHLANLWLLEGGKVFAADDLKEVLAVSRRLARVLAAGSSVQLHRTTEDTFLLNILSSDRPRASLSSLADRLSDVHSIRFVIILQTDDQRRGPRPLSDGKFHALESTLGRLPRDRLGICAAAVTRTRGALILRDGPRRAPDKALEAIRVALAPLESKHRALLTAMSEATDLAKAHLDEARHQADILAVLASHDPALPADMSMRDARLYRALLPIPELSSDGCDILAPLADEPELVETLETFLDLAGDVTKTASALHIHRTSAYYRLDRIQQFLDADLKDGLTRSHLHAELKKRRLRPLLD